MRIKHLNLNIWMGKLLPAALDFIKKENPDIISLQEVFNNRDPAAPINLKTLEVLLKELKYPYYIYYPDFLNEIKILAPVPTPDGGAVFSRFPIIQHKQVYIYGEYRQINENSILEQAPRSLVCAEIKVEGTTVNIFNYHGIWGRHGEDTEKRIESVKKILEIIGNTSKVILSGDFNLNERIFGTKFSFKPDFNHWHNTQSVQILESKLNNVFKNERVRSFNMKRKDLNTGYSYATVDMVFVSPDIKVLSHTQPEVDVSDHLPQICEFEI